MVLGSLSCDVDARDPAEMFVVTENMRSASACVEGIKDPIRTFARLPSSWRTVHHVP